MLVVVVMKAGATSRRSTATEPADAAAQATVGS